MTNFRIPRGTTDMMVTDPAYKEHAVFADLDRYITFYSRLAQSVIGWAPMGTSAFLNIDSYVFSSMQGTLSSIRMLLEHGRINDAYALLRKFHDTAIINIYSILYLDEHFDIDNFVVAQVNDWLMGKTSLPEFRKMSQYIRSSSRVSPITSVLNVDDRYKAIRNRCNDHMHFNFYRNVLLNDNEIHLPNRNQALNELSADMRDIFILHVAYLLFTKENYMMSSDYVDCLECGMEPEVDSQYWVAPFIQEVFDGVLKKWRPDIASLMKASTSMQLS
jgi:hypothetical protein